ncbi:MAG: hypothetical protein M0Q26_05950 [Chitinophagaceae bacterium]|nr:hypothetical protein [Chitinophagaceae bacterium]MDP1763426.1 hypothetical protein [Sediminibacterium sp.]
MDTISLQDLISCMDKGETFAIGFRTLDQHKNTGGEYVGFAQACKHRHATADERKAVNRLKQDLLKNPNHYANSTRNIRVLATGNIVKIHLRLITMFNYKAVL